MAIIPIEHANHHVTMCGARWAVSPCKALVLTQQLQTIREIYCSSL